VRGRVTDAETDAPLAASVQVDANPFPTYTDPDVGDYHRPSLPGDYTLTVGATGYATATVPITVGSGPATRYDVALTPLPTDLLPAGRRVIDADGYASPGETVDLAVTLANSGRQATTVSATLVPTGWYASAPRATASYQDIPTGGSRESDAPYYGIAVDTATPSGHKAGFAVRWSSDQGSGTSDPFFVDIGSPQCGTLPSSDVPQSILDHSTTTSTLVLNEDIELRSVEVEIDLTHTYIGDLVVSLTSPAGNTVVLHDRSGSSADDIVGTYGTDLAAAESLDGFAGEAALGTWTLEVRDEATGDTGTLNAWGLTTCGQPIEAIPPEMRFRELVPVDGSVRLEWWPYPGLESYRVYRSTAAADAGAFVDLTPNDDDPADTLFVDDAAPGLAYYLVSGVGPRGEGPR
jgi:subtilisin-like proprotein convertase family protein